MRGGSCFAEACGEADAVGERALKRTWSPRPSVVPPVPSPCAADAAGRAGRSEERTGARAAMEPAPMPNLQPEEALPAASVVKQSGRSEGQTGARSVRDL